MIRNETFEKMKKADDFSYLFYADGVICKVVHPCEKVFYINFYITKEIISKSEIESMIEKFSFFSCSKKEESHTDKVLDNIFESDIAEIAYIVTSGSEVMYIDFCLSLLNLIVNNFSSWLMFSVFTNNRLPEKATHVDLRHYKQKDFNELDFRFTDFDYSSNAESIDLSNLVKRWRKVKVEEAQYCAKQFAMTIAQYKKASYDFGDFELNKIDLRSIINGNLSYGPVVHSESYYSTGNILVDSFVDDENDKISLNIEAHRALAEAINNSSLVLSVNDMINFVKSFERFPLTDIAFLISNVIEKVIEQKESLTFDDFSLGKLFGIEMSPYQPANIYIEMIAGYLNKFDEGAAYDLKESLLSFQEKLLGNGLKISPLGKVLRFLFNEKNLQDLVKMSDVLDVRTFLALNGYLLS